MFKLIPSTNNLYEASDKGEIRRIVSEVNNQPGHKAPGVKKVGGNILIPGVKENGYLHISVHIDRKQMSRYIHRLVAEAWFGGIPPKMTVNHKDGDKTNNCVDNLEIMTQSENNKHAFRTGLKKPTILKGSKNPRAITNEEEVLKIRQDHSEHHSIVRLLLDYPHMKKGALAMIVYRRSWKHI